MRQFPCATKHDEDAGWNLGFGELFDVSQECNGMSMEDVELVINVLTRRGYMQVADPRMPTLKRDHWSNAEVCALLDGCMVGELSQDMNFGLHQAKILFGDMGADPATVAGAKALDTATGRVVCVGPRLPQ